MFFFPCDYVCHGIGSCIFRATEKLDLTIILDGFVQSGYELVVRVSLRGDALNLNTGSRMELHYCLPEVVDLVGISAKVAKTLRYQFINVLD